MGKRGPSKTPTSVLESRGSRRAKGREGEPEPEAVGEVPAPPEHLPGEAAAVWLELAAPLTKCGLMTAVDPHAFERYCRTYAMWRRMMHEMEQGEGEVDRFVVTKITHADQMLRRLERAFGLSPADRADLNVNAPKEDNGKSRFFKPKLVG